jgi:hypothetical protein
VDQQRESPRLRCSWAASPARQGLGGDGGHFFELLAGQLAPRRDAARPSAASARQLLDAVRRLQQHGGARFGRQGLHRGGALTGLAGQKARERRKPPGCWA